MNLTGLAHVALREALIAHGRPDKQANMCVAQSWHWIDENASDADARRELMLIKGILARMSRPRHPRQAQPRHVHHDFDPAE